MLTLKSFESCLSSDVDTEMRYLNTQGDRANFDRCRVVASVWTRQAYCTMRQMLNSLACRAGAISILCKFPSADVYVQYTFTRAFNFHRTEQKWELFWTATVSVTFVWTPTYCFNVLLELEITNPMATVPASRAQSPIVSMLPHRHIVPVARKIVDCEQDIGRTQITRGKRLSFRWSVLYVA